MQILNYISKISPIRRQAYPMMIRVLLIVIALSFLHLVSPLHLFSSSVQAADENKPPSTYDHEIIPYQLTLYQFTTEFSTSKQVYNDDLTIESDEVIPDDIFVYSGNVKIKDDGLLQGSLSVYDGNVEIEEGALVEGDVLIYSGDLKVAGSINGRIASVSGDVELEESAYVQGAISLFSGELTQKEGARVDGDLIGIVEKSENVGDAVVIPDMSNSMWEGFLGLLIRLVLTTFVTFATIVLVGLLAYVRPAIVQSVQETIHERLALSFITGLLCNLALIVLIALLSLTFCLIPIALLPVLLLVGLNLVGWAALSAIAGERVCQMIQFRSNFADNFIRWPAMKVVVGAALLTVPLALFWMFGSLIWIIGGCLQFIVWIGTLILTSIGTGAVVRPWINRISGGGPGGYILRKDRPH